MSLSEREEWYIAIAAAELVEVEAVGIAVGVDDVDVALLVTTLGILLLLATRGLLLTLVVEVELVLKCCC